MGLDYSHILVMSKQIFIQIQFSTAFMIVGIILRFTQGFGDACVSTAGIHYLVLSYYRIFNYNNRISDKERILYWLCTSFSRDRSYAWTCYGISTIHICKVRIHILHICWNTFAIYDSCYSHYPIKNQLC